MTVAPLATVESLPEAAANVNGGCCRLLPYQLLLITRNPAGSTLQAAGPMSRSRLNATDPRLLPLKPPARRTVISSSPCPRTKCRRSRRGESSAMEDRLHQSRGSLHTSSASLSRSISTSLGDESAHRLFEAGLRARTPVMPKTGLRRISRSAESLALQHHKLLATLPASSLSPSPLSVESRPQFRSLSRSRSRSQSLSISLPDYSHCLSSASGSSPLPPALVIKHLPDSPATSRHSITK
ncbi:unnamed protein product [Protopolystoma xenopodis]|uniref:Uncharacterized protein n=1 Tax=Protopolystoma xenopodis TaxID=117903 RepID=A0A3S5FCE4_9PLAT|nr:unnamed protein product [Protopolystoma xenopodis]